MKTSQKDALTKISLCAIANQFALFRATVTKKMRLVTGGDQRQNPRIISANTITNCDIIQSLKVIKTKLINRLVLYLLYFDFPK